MLPVPFYKQETDFSCGPAVLRMIFEYFGKNYSEQYLIASLAASANDGTRHGKLLDTVRRHGFYALVSEGASLGDARQFVEDKKIPVIVNFIDPQDKEGHYAVVVGMNNSHIFLNDPERGEKYSMDVRNFEAAWKNGFEDGERWMMAVSDIPFPDRKNDLLF